jgi:hypothetical protein
MAQEYIIEQLSIFVPNKPGKLAAIAELLYENKVNIYAFTIAEAKEFGVVRAIVDKPGEALRAFEERNYLAKLTNVLAIRMFDAPGGLYEVANILGKAGINIEYAYASRSRESPALIVYISNGRGSDGKQNMSEFEKAVDVILDAGLILVPAEECCR